MYDCTILPDFRVRFYFSQVFSRCLDVCPPVDWGLFRTSNGTLDGSFGLLTTLDGGGGRIIVVTPVVQSSPSQSLSLSFSHSLFLSLWSLSRTFSRIEKLRYHWGGSLFRYFLLLAWSIADVDFSGDKLLDFCLARGWLIWYILFVSEYVVLLNCSSV